MFQDCVKWSTFFSSIILVMCRNSMLQRFKMTAFHVLSSFLISTSCKVQLAVFILLSQVAASVLDTIVCKFLFRYENKSSLEIRKGHSLFYYVSISDKT